MFFSKYFGLKKETAEVDLLKQQDYFRLIKCSSREVSASMIESLLFPEEKTRLIVGFISPHVDFKNVSQMLRQLIPNRIKVVLVSTAGELCSLGQNVQTTALYLDTPNQWDNIVLQSFSVELIQSVEVYSIHLGNEDLKKGLPTKTRDERIRGMGQQLQKITPSFKINSNDTIALTFFDGLSGSENFFAEAVYKTNRFPCLFIGGSAGGKLDFQKTYIFDSNQVVENHAVICLIKVAEGIRFGVFKTQNFEKTNVSFPVIEANIYQRYVKRVQDKKTGELISLVDALSQYFHCAPSQLETKLREYAFAVIIEGEIYVRSVSKIDLENKNIYFYCDIAFGDELFLVKTKDFISQTQQDFQRFSQGKPNQPIIGILNDCILRRLFNQTELNHLHIFDHIPVAGFSTFGELLGVNINQTLTALFFYHVDPNQEFFDEYIDNFPMYYGSFKSYFSIAELNRQLLANRVYRQLIEKLQSYHHFVDELMDSSNEIRTYSTSVHENMLKVQGEFSQYAGTVDYYSKTYQILSKEVSQLVEDIGKIEEVLSLIGQIAVKTNLLALNASIESARAGEVGRGFGVVADEVRKLATNTQDSLGKTNAIIQQIGQSTEKIVKDIKNTEEQHQLVETQGQKLTEQIALLDALSKGADVHLEKNLTLITQITYSMQETKIVSDELHDIMKQD